MNAKLSNLVMPRRTSAGAIRNLKPETLARALEAFESGRLGAAARIFEAIAARDDLISGLFLKRRKCVARLDGEVVEIEDSKVAKEHARVLRDFYSSIEAENFSDANERGGLRLLIAQMMNAVGMKYAAHKVQYRRDGSSICAKFTHYPLWMFENTSGKLRLLEREGQLSEGVELNEGEWLITTSDGLMLPSSVAYIFKHLTLRDWLIYCERNGMPGVKAKTDAYPGSEQWDAACKAASDFGAEFHAVFSQGTDIEAIDLSSRGALPYPQLVERMDRMLCALWRGGDLATIGGESALGSTSQWYESSLIEEDDAENIAQTLNMQVDKTVIRLAFGEVKPLAKFVLRLPDYETHLSELSVIERLAKIGLKPDPLKLAKRFGFPLKEEH
ncbi:MAG: DUF935 family protein [Opitutales bacterium]|nr:DUF935 family protein [Opitutales bacterium]